MNTVNIPDIINELEVIRNSENKKEKLQSLLNKVRNSAIVLNYVYSFIVDAIKTMINTLDNEDCNKIKEEIHGVINGPLKVLYHVNNS